MLKPEQRITWKGSGASVPKPSGPAAQKAAAVKKAGLGSNSIPQSQMSLEQLKKMAASRGISVEKLVAQMVQQYLKEDGPAS
jgi:hypothetical protein